MVASGAPGGVLGGVLQNFEIVPVAGALALLKVNCYKILFKTALSTVFSSREKVTIFLFSSGAAPSFWTISIALSLLILPYPP
jgi:hypothetical protein